MTCGNGGFPQLRVLKLWVLKELKEWTIKEGAMTALEELEIRNCPKLKMPTELNKLSNLKELTLVDMKKSFEDEARGCMAKTVNIVVKSSKGEFLYFSLSTSLLQNLIFTFHFL